MEIIIYPYNNGTDTSYNGLDEIEDLDEFLKTINANTTKFTVRGSRIEANAFSYVGSNLKKIWIPSTCTTIEAPSYDKSPFYPIAFPGTPIAEIDLLSPDLQIFTDVVSSAVKPSGWGPYWNYYSETQQLTVHWNSNKAIYKAFNIS